MERKELRQKIKILEITQIFMSLIVNETIATMGSEDKFK